MAMDERLKRNGLYHLKDRPDELKKEIRRRELDYLSGREQTAPAMEHPEANRELVLKVLRKNRQKNRTPKLRKRNNDAPNR
ncbi:MAG TPA: hypothetical protein VGK47_00610 [Nitrososphaeraceae archaeon]